METNRDDSIDRVSVLKPFKLKAIVDKPKAVNQIPTTGQIAKKKCKERELLKAKNRLIYWCTFLLQSYIEFQRFYFPRR